MKPTFDYQIRDDHQDGHANERQQQVSSRPTGIDRWFILRRGEGRGVVFGRQDLDRGNDDSQGSFPRMLQLEFDPFNSGLKPMQFQRSGRTN